MLTPIKSACVNSCAKKHDASARKSRWCARTSFDTLPTIRRTTHSWLASRRRRTIPFARNRNVHYSSIARVAPFPCHSKQMNATTKRLRYSLISNHRSHPSYAHHPVRPQSTILAEKYLLLLQIIREMRADIRRSYAGSRTSMENLRKRIIKARTIILQCKDLCSRREYDHCQVLTQHHPSVLPVECSSRAPHRST